MTSNNNFIISKSPDDTIFLAKQLASKYPDKLVLLHGELGAGKTLFARGFAEGLNIKATVSSPSYTLMNEYKAKDFSMFHIDLYRLNCFEEVIDIGLFDVIEAKEPCLIEWAERIEELEKLPHLEVNINRLEKSEDRIISWQWKEPTK